jgi:hypothetical protein
MRDERRIVRLGENRWLVHRNENGFIDEVRDVTAALVAAEPAEQRARSKSSE